MKNSNRFILTICFLLLALACHAKQAKPNFVIIAVDDLRTELNTYGVDRAITPNFDRLADSGVQFDYAYCQTALCAPSRASIMTGTLPINNGITAMTSMHEELQHQIVTEALTFPQYFKENGYNTLSIGKIFHNYNTEDDDAWTDGRRAKGSGYMTKENRAALRKFRDGIAAGKKPWQLKRGNSVEMFEGDGEGHQDYGVATGSIELLKEYYGQDKPFMLTLGFYKPHLPFVAPKKYWDLYDRETIEVPSREHPTNVALHALVASWYEVRHYGDIPNHAKDLNDAQTKELIHGYLACVSYVDAQLGRVLDEVAALDLKDDTYIALWSDHGFMLGDYGDWSKYTVMEMDVRVPLIFAGPGIPKNSISDTPVELLDLYPTLCALAGLPIPEHTEGVSLVPELHNPNSSDRIAALSLYDRAKPSIHGANPNEPPAQAYSVRTKNYRYTEWYNIDSGELIDVELYDHSESPMAIENLADKPEFAATVKAHSQLIKDDPRLQK